MAKELPYFQFEPAEYLTGDISFCSLETQGLFINLCSYYWQRSCKLTKEQFLRRINNEKCFNELVSENVIILENEVIKITFLDEQFKKATTKSKTNSINGSKGGRPKKINPNKTETKPNKNPNESETKGIRKDKIREDNKKEDNIINNSQFANESLNSSQWLETTAMQKQITIDTVKLFINHFNDHLITMEEQKKSTKDFKSHFIYWLNKQDLSRFRKKVIGKTNQI